MRDLIDTTSARASPHGTALAGRDVNCVLHHGGMRFPFFILGIFIGTAGASPSAVSTFHSIGLYWSPQGASEQNTARVEFRKRGDGDWRRGLELWFDARNAEYRGSLVELEPGSIYQIRLSLESGLKATLETKTWSEKFPVKRTVEVKPGKRVVIRAEDSGDENGYVVFTAPPGRNVIEGDDQDDSCVVIRQGAHHVIVRGLVLRNCKRYGILIQRQSEPVTDSQTRDVVIEDNEITGWGGYEMQKKDSRLADSDGAIHCNYYRETDDRRRPDRIIVQGNRIRDPRHGANPWHSSAHGRKHPYGPLGMMFDRCGRNHVIRYNEIGSANGNHYKDGIGGADNFSAAGFPWADADIYANRISNVYDDGIEAEGANRNVRIWGNYLDRVYVAIANAATAVGPLYVWRNVSHRTTGMLNPEGSSERGPFIKAGSNNPQFNGGRAYYFHNSAMEPSRGIAPSGGRLYNYVSVGNLFDPRRPERPERIANFNDRYARPEPGARQSGAPPMRYGAEAYTSGRSAH
jgi:hypothetical protein